MKGEGKEGNPTVLIVEDELIVANLIERKLEKIGFSVVGNVSTGEDALKMAAKKKPNLILMDIKLGGEMDGVEAAEQIDRELRIPIIYLTAHADKETLKRAKFTKPLGYIVKPFDEIDLRSSIEIALYRHEVEMKLRESEQRYKSLFEGIPIPLFRMSPDRRLLNANNALINCLKFPDAGIGSDVRIPDFFMDPADVERYERLISNEGEVHDFETLIQCHDGSTIWVNINSRMALDREGTPLAEEGSLVDITLRKHSEEEMKRKLMKFKLEEGNIYLVKEMSPTLALEALQDLQTIGYRGTIISRTSEKDWLRVVEKDFNYFWFAERGGKKSIKPDFNKLSTFLSSFTRNNVLLMDRMDYLIFKNDFASCLMFIQDLRELASLKKFIAILSVDHLLLKQQELRLIEKECKEIMSTHQSILSDDLLRVLRFIYKQNIIGIKPSYSTIAKELRISRPTVRKRLTLLASTGYVIEHARGNSKVLELTERGREMFWK